MHTVETVRGSHVRLFEDDAVKCNSCGREGVIQTFDGIATVLWETDEERAEGAAMTNNQLTRERIELIANFHRAMTLPPSHDEIEELARMALAAMDSEPVAWRVSFTQIGHESNNFTKTYWDEEEKDRWVKLHKMSGYKVVVEPLYRHAQPAPVVPDGYVMVPKEPTDEMIAAAMNCDDVLFNSDESFCVQFGSIYESMLAAAPQEVKGE